MEEGKKKLYSIGKVSELLQIPASALRFYDEEKILSPEVRNDETGYRYYAEKQIMKCLTLSEMRRLDIPVSDIRKLFEGRNLPVLRGILEKRQESLKKKIEELEFKNHYIDELIVSIDRGIDCLAESRFYKKECTPVKIWHMPAFLAVRLPVYGCFYEQEKFCRTQKELLDICEDRRLKICGQPISRFHDPGKVHLGKDFYESEWLLPVKKPDKEKEDLIEFPETWVVGTCHIGSYSNISLQYERVLKFAEENEVKIAGTPMEEYVINCGNIYGSENFVTNVMFPINNVGSEIE